MRIGFALGSSTIPDRHGRWVIDIPFPTLSIFRSLVDSTSEFLIQNLGLLVDGLVDHPVEHIGSSRQLLVPQAFQLGDVSAERTKYKL